MCLEGTNGMIKSAGPDHEVFWIFGFTLFAQTFLST